MAANANDLFTKVGFGTATNLAAPGYTSGVSTSINVTSTSAWPSDTGVIFAMDEVETNSDGDEVRVSGTYNVFEGTVASATQIDNVDYIGGDAERSYSAGATTRVYILPSSYLWNRLISGLMAEHDHLDGTHTDITATSLTIGSVTWAALLTGWIQTGESWSYASWDSTNKTGTITVPTDATTKYSVGMRIRITQSTGGTKYAILTKVEATTLTAYFGTDYTLNNEAISSPFYSTKKAPYGFPTDVAKWTQSYTYTDDNNVTSIAQVGAHQLSIPIGSWRVSMRANLQITCNGNNTAQLRCGLSTATGSFSDGGFFGSIKNPQVAGLTGNVQGDLYIQKTITVTTATVYYQIASRTGATLTSSVIGSDPGGRIEAVSALL